LTAGFLAVIAYARNPSDWYIPIFFAFLAFMNLQSLQTIHQAQKMGLNQDDDWWRDSLAARRSAAIIDGCAAASVFLAICSNVEYGVSVVGWVETSGRRR